jgi:hypothetical protein
MRIAWVVVAACVFGGCVAGGRGTATWPKSSAPTADDGGESIAPHQAHAAAAAIEADDTVKPVLAAPAPEPVIAPPAAVPTAPVIAPPTAASDDPMMTEDIVIEVDE